MDSITSHLSILKDHVDDMIMKMDLNTYYEAARNFTTTNPYTTCGMALGSAVFLGPGIAAGSVINGAGFTAGGVSAGSCAAWIHSNIGPVAAKSVFAYCQSAAAGGYGVAVVNGITQGAGAALAAGSAYWSDWIYGGSPLSSDDENEVVEYVVIHPTLEEAEN